MRTETIVELNIAVFALSMFFTCGYLLRRWQDYAVMTQEVRGVVSVPHKKPSLYYRANDGG